MESKYVRTKYGVYALKKKLKHDIYVYIFVNEKDKVIKRYYNVTIIKEANTIEELCDEFIFICEDFDKPQLVIPMNFDYCKKIFKHTEIYGAIWTDKGLIYVAKMNNDGEFKLI